MADNNVLKGYWCFDKTIDVGTGIDFSINYTCTINSTKYKGNRIFTNAALGMLYQYDDNGSNNMTLVYAPDTYSNAWNDDDSQTIFVNDEVEQTEGLLSWLQTNATKVEFDYNLEEQSVNEYLYVISNLQSKMQNLIISQGGTVKYKSLEQYMQSLIDLRKKFVELLASFNVSASESEKMSPAWADKFNQVVANLVKGYDLTDLEIVDDTTKTLSNIEAYGVPHIKKLTFNKLESISGETNFNGTTADEVWFNTLVRTYVNNNKLIPFLNAKFKKVHMPSFVGASSSSSYYYSENMFQNNTYLTHLYLDNAEYIPQNMLYGCSSLVELYAPNVKEVHSGGIRETSIETLDLPLATNVSLAGNKKLKYLNIPLATNVSLAGNSALETLDLPNLKTVSQSAFNNCTSLKSVNLPIATLFKNEAFNNCTSLESFKFYNDVVIPYRLFYNCSSLTTIEGKPLSIGNSAFYNCTSLTTIDLSKTTNIEVNCFQNCSSLKRIEITNSMELNVGGHFSGCSALEEAILTGITYWNTNQSSPFKNCTSLTTIDLSNCTYLSGGWTSPFQDCTSLTTIKFDSLDKCSCNYMFQGCSVLTEVNFPKLTTDTASYTFKYSNVSIVRYGILATIRANLFDSATSLTDVYLGAEQVVTLSSTNAFSSATAAKPVTIHVKPAYADSYATATNWSSLISAGKIIIVGDYSD